MFRMVSSVVSYSARRIGEESSTLSSGCFSNVLKTWTSFSSANLELDDSESSSSWEILLWLNLEKPKPSRPGVVGSILF